MFKCFICIDIDHIALNLFVDGENLLSCFQIINDNTEQFRLSSDVDHRKKLLIFALNKVNQQTLIACYFSFFSYCFDPSQSSINRFNFAKLALKLVKTRFQRVSFQFSFIVLKHFVFHNCSNLTLFLSSFVNLCLSSFYLG